MTSLVQKGGKVSPWSICCQIKTLGIPRACNECKSSKRLIESHLYVTQWTLKGLETPLSNTHLILHPDFFIDMNKDLERTFGRKGIFCLSEGI